MSDSRKPLTYAESGVDIDVGNRIVDRIRPFARGTRRSGAGAELGGFGGLFDLKAAGFVDPILVAANDGVGTKVKIAIESGLYDTIGIDLVAMCVNDIVVQGAEPLFFLDYFASGKLDEDTTSVVVRSIAEGCAQSGCALIGGETAEMPGLYASGDFDIAGFAVGAAERGTLLPRPGLKPGDLVFGLPSSGVHSNGFSLVRRIVARTGLAWEASAPFDPSRSLAAALLTPTRLYVLPMLDALKRTRGIHALAHITAYALPTIKVYTANSLPTLTHDQFWFLYPRSVLSTHPQSVLVSLPTVSFLYPRSALSTHRQLVPVSLPTVSSEFSHCLYEGKCEYIRNLSLSEPIF